jgi:hypothetical protein
VECGTATVLKEGKGVKEEDKDGDEEEREDDMGESIHRE